MQITIISGSHRPNAQSLKVARFMQTVLEQAGVTAEVLSLGGNPLPLWDQGVWEGTPAWTEALSAIQEQCRRSDGFVVISPEWHGQVPAGLKNLFLLLGRTEVGHKPALIVTVSTGDGGAYPVAELRMSSYKNNRICYLPEHVVVRKVESVLNDDPATNDADSDAYIRGRLTWAGGILKAYAEALRPVRESGVTEDERFPFGM